MGDGKEEEVDGKETTEPPRFLKAGLAGAAAVGLARLGEVPARSSGRRPPPLRGPKFPSFRAPISYRPPRISTKSRPRSGPSQRRTNRGSPIPQLAGPSAQDRRGHPSGRGDIVELWPIWNFLYQIISWTLPTWPRKWGGEAEVFETFVLNSCKVKGRYWASLRSFRHGRELPHKLV